MDYQKIYDSLIHKRQITKPLGYVELHHIHSRGLGGGDEKSNLVYLTGREHWAAHLLLHKIHCKPQTAWACSMMSMKDAIRGIPLVKNSKMYEAIRKEAALHTSSIMKTMTGEKNSQFGTRWICNLESKKNKNMNLLKATK